MAKVFKLSVKGELEIPSVYFDDKDRLERFVFALQTIMTKEALKSTEFIAEEILVITSDEEVIEAFKQMQDIDK